MQMAGGAGGWEELGDSHPERIGHYFLALLRLGGIVFWQEILKSVCVGKGPVHRREQKPPEPLVRAGAAGPLWGRGCSEMSCTAPRAAAERQDAPLSSCPRAHVWSVHRRR